VHQGRGLQRLPRFFFSEFLSRKPSEFVVQQRQELLSGRGITGFDSSQDLRNVAHGRGLQEWCQRSRLCRIT